MQENIEFFESHPLFMKELPKNLEENKHLTALQNIMYDDEPVNIARNMNVSRQYKSNLFCREEE